MAVLWSGLVQGWAERVEVVKQYRVLDVRGCLGDGQDGWSGRTQPPDPTVWQPRPVWGVWGTRTRRSASLPATWQAKTPAPPAGSCQTVGPRPSRYGDMAGEPPAPPGKESGVAYRLKRLPRSVLPYGI